MKHFRKRVVDGLRLDYREDRAGRRWFVSVVSVPSVVSVQANATRKFAENTGVIDCKETPAISGETKQADAEPQTTETAKTTDVDLVWLNETFDE